MQHLKVNRNMHSNTLRGNLCKPLFVCLWGVGGHMVGGGGGHTSPARVFARKSCVTICRRLPPRQHARLKLIVNCLLLAKAWAVGAQGHIQGLATISDGLGRGGGGEGEGGRGACVSRHSCYTTYSESQTHLHCCKTSPQLPLMPECVPPSGWILLQQP